MSKKPSMLIAKTFAEEMNIDYRTALNWLKAGLVPGAERKASPVGEYWEIPATALKMERPKPGPKPGTKANGTSKKASKK